MLNRSLIPEPAHAKSIRVTARAGPMLRPPGCRRGQTSEVTGRRAKSGSPKDFSIVDTVNCISDDVDIVNTNYLIIPIPSERGPGRGSAPKRPSGQLRPR